jgi:alpha-tubulin suppressor-like RCC1 family protein
MPHQCHHTPLVAGHAFIPRALCGWLLAAVLSLIAASSQSWALDILSGSQQGLIATSGYHTCALTQSSNAGVKCWGANYTGQIGDGTTAQRTSPVSVMGLSSGVAAVGVGDSFSCALLTNGEVRCWGNNASGQLGNNFLASSTTPVAVGDASTGNALTGATFLSVGAHHACVVLSSGGAKCWGGNTSGQLGDGTSTNRGLAVDVVGFSSNVQTIDAGFSHTCLASVSPNRIYCFGSNSYNQLGDGTGLNSASPVLVSGYSNAVDVSAGNQHSCARVLAGELICWGDNSQGALGDGTTNSPQYPISIIYSGLVIQRISAGFGHTCGTRASDGEVLCWGRGAEGQIGDGALIQRNYPTSLSPRVIGAIDISSQGYHACAWMGPCSATCWGSNSDGQLGNGTLNSSGSPISISFCNYTGPTPAPTVVPTHTPTPTPLPDACASETSCVPDDTLNNPLNIRPPTLTVSASNARKPIALRWSVVKLGIPVALAQREALRRRLSKFLNYKITNLASAIRSLQVYYDVSIGKAPAVKTSEFSSSALPKKYRIQTRNRRVSTRLGPGTYVARVTVRLKDSRGRTFVTGKRPGQTTFAVR